MKPPDIQDFTIPTELWDAGYMLDQVPKRIFNDPEIAKTLGIKRKLIRIIRILEPGYFSLVDTRKDRNILDDLPCEMTLRAYLIDLVKAIA